MLNYLYRYACIIRNIVDGDTIDVDIDLGFDNWILNERVRLSGIDCPEVRTRDLVEKEFGFLAAARVSELLPIGERFYLVSERYNRRGSFGRILGNFILDIDNGQDLRTVLLEERHGVIWNPNDREEMKRLHLINREYLMNSDSVSIEFKTNIQRLINEQEL